MNDPRMTGDHFARTFPRYGREFDKLLNRLYPEGYAPKSWFSTAKKLKAKQRVVDAGGAPHTAAAKAQQVANAETDALLREARQLRGIGREQVFVWKSPAILFGAGIHNPGIEHYGSRSSTPATCTRPDNFGPRELPVDGTRPHELPGKLRPRLETARIAELNAEVGRLTALAETLKQRGGGRAYQAVKNNIRHVQRLLDREVACTRNAGDHLRTRIDGFDNSVGRTSRTQRGMEAMKEEGEGGQVLDYL